MFVQYICVCSFIDFSYVYIYARLFKCICFM